MGVITGLLALVPVVSPFINIFVIGAVALIQGSTTLALHPAALAALAVVTNLIFAAIVAELILPKIWGTAVSLPTIVIIPGVVIGAALLGPLGALFSVALLGFAADLGGYAVHKIRGGDPYPGEPEPLFYSGPWPPGRCQARAVSAIRICSSDVSPIRPRQNSHTISPAMSVGLS